MAAEPFKGDYLVAWNVGEKPEDGSTVSEMESLSDETIDWLNRFQREKRNPSGSLKHQELRKLGSLPNLRRNWEIWHENNQRVK